ncbi:GLPGLI family protein [Chryseobacterium sp. LC2016-29]|uniref:GLPGLI family protein n=1 Tax=Chryseobacterium sp. LC2016-29 TaxID=2897331 RepID=UPI001E54870D|nr:GLPGLI family protein [Chryseobacterium sp. LC2016-29]MCD0477525.1 GLPGLI family protein [Chryseobacterium sp. LC2016-29]
MKGSLFLLVFFFSLSTAQNNRFFYEVKFKEDSTQTEHQKVFMVLDINPTETKYYDNTFLEKDSINKANHSQLTNWTSQIPVTRKKNSNKNSNYTFIDNQLYSYPTEDLIQWKLSDKTKKYLHFDLQEATANFGGRKWTAWFTKEIPLSEGPYKFTGLPGLIVLLEDDRNQYSFALVKSKKLEKTYDTSNFLEVRYGKKPLPISEKMYLKKSLEYYNDPLQQIRAEIKNGTIKSYEDGGKRYSKPEELVPLIREEQEYIRQNNNPIELNKAIKYPVK